MVRNANLYQAILYYAPTIFKGLGLSNNSVSLLATGVVGIAMFLVGTIAPRPVTHLTVPGNHPSSHVRR